MIRVGPVGVSVGAIIGLTILFVILIGWYVKFLVFAPISNNTPVVLGQQFSGNTCINNSAVYLTLSQYQTLIGPGGVFSCAQTTNASLIANYVNERGITNNVTAAWGDGYNSGPPQNAVATEYVYQSSDAKQIYTQQLQEAINNTGNMSVGGFEYAYGLQPEDTFLWGWKDNYFVYFQSSKVIPQNAIADAIAADLP